MSDGRVTWRGKMAAAGAVTMGVAMILGAVPATRPGTTRPAVTRPAATQAAGPARTRIQQLIAEAGRTPPGWWDSVELKYPPTLALTWTQAGKGEWNNQKHLGAYIWDIINPNPDRWREGVKLVHHTLTVNKDNKEKVARSVEQLARMYFELLGDFPRAAFWAQKSGRDPLLLANCYWKMGSKEMAAEILTRLGADNTRNGSTIKLWSDMGELDKALRLAEQKARAGAPDAAYLAAGDACRLAGKYKQALGFYEKVTQVSRGNNDREMNGKRARASIEAIKLFDVLDLARIPDGTYTSASMGYNGSVEVSVTVKAGSIEDVGVGRHQEKQFFSSITDTTGQIIAKQGVKGIDATSGATITSEAIINATAKALAGGMK